MVREGAEPEEPEEPQEPEEPEEPDETESEEEIDWQNYFAECTYCFRDPGHPRWSGWAGPGRAGEPICIACFG